MRSFFVAFAFFCLSFGTAVADSPNGSLPEVSFSTIKKFEDLPTEHQAALETKFSRLWTAYVSGFQKGYDALAAKYPVLKTSEALKSDDTLVEILAAELGIEDTDNLSDEIAEIFAKEMSALPEITETSSHLWIGYIDQARPTDLHRNQELLVKIGDRATLAAAILVWEQTETHIDFMIDSIFPGRPYWGVTFSWTNKGELHSEDASD